MSNITNPAVCQVVGADLNIQVPSSFDLESIRSAGKNLSYKRKKQYCKTTHHSIDCLAINLAARLAEIKEVTCNQKNGSWANEVHDMGMSIRHADRLVQANQVIEKITRHQCPVILPAIVETQLSQCKITTLLRLIPLKDYPEVIIEHIAAGDINLIEMSARGVEDQVKKITALQRKKNATEIELRKTQKENQMLKQEREELLHGVSKQYIDSVIIGVEALELQARQAIDNLSSQASDFFSSHSHLTSHKIQRKRLLTALRAATLSVHEKAFELKTLFKQAAENPAYTTDVTEKELALLIEQTQQTLETRS